MVEVEILNITSRVGYAGFLKKLAFQQLEEVMYSGVVSCACAGMCVLGICY